MPRWIVPLVAQMIGELAVEHRFQHRLRQTGQQPARADQLKGSAFAPSMN